MTRGTFLKLLGLATIFAAFKQRSGAQTASIEKWVDPPGEETAAIKKLIDQASQALANDKTTSDILGDRAYQAAHAFPRFRKLIRDHASKAPITIVSADEPGTRSVVRIRVLNAGGVGVSNALIYIYHTSAKGWYSDRAYHIRANSGDEKHARLFGYVRTDTSGYAEVRTVRPGGYPDGNLPEHFHVEVLEPSTVVSEIQFSDDPRLTESARAESRRNGFFIAAPRKVDDVVRIEAEFRLGR